MFIKELKTMKHISDFDNYKKNESIMDLISQITPDMALQSLSIGMITGFLLYKFLEGLFKDKFRRKITITKKPGFENKESPKDWKYKLLINTIEIVRNKGINVEIDGDEHKIYSYGHLAAIYNKPNKTLSITQKDKSFEIELNDDKIKELDKLLYWYYDKTKNKKKGRF